MKRLFLVSCLKFACAITFSGVFIMVMTSFSQAESNKRDLLLGIHSHFTRTEAWDNEYGDIEKTFETLKKVGFDYIRVGFVWKQIQQKPDVWNWDQIDKVIALAKKYQVHILGLVHAPPDWAFPAYEHLDEWSKFITEVVSRYGASIDGWEIWNEPNVDHFWPKNAPIDGFLNVLRYSYNIIKKQYPNKPVLIGGMANNHRLFAMLEDMMSHGALSYCDGIALHPYKMTGEELIQRYNRIRQMMFKYSRKDMEIWVTEYGWSAKSSGGSEGVKNKKIVATLPEQADRILKTYLAHVAAGGGPFIIYELRDDKNSTLGIFGRDFTKKPAADAVSWMIRKLASGYTILAKKVFEDGMLLEITTGDNKNYYITWGSQAFRELNRDVLTDKKYKPESYTGMDAESIRQGLNNNLQAVTDQVIFWEKIL